VLLVHVLASTGLVAHHVRAESSSLPQEDGTSDVVLARILSGPVHWTTLDRLVFGILIVMAMELLNWIVRHSGEWLRSKPIPARGQHLDELTPKDKLFIGISKAQTGPFVYFFLRFLCSEHNAENILWSVDEVSLRTALLPLPALFLVYDFFYTVLHWALHIRAIYPYVHKHHHAQKAPSRGNEDAINVHPLEFFLGEYNHLWSWFLCCRVLGLRIHAVAALLYLALAGVLAGWNHTRFDVAWSVLGVPVFDAKVHDVHHRIPRSNYGQYTIFWDTVFGTYRPYNPDEKTNPDYQLDPKTCVSLKYLKRLGGRC